MSRDRAQMTNRQPVQTSQAKDLSETSSKGVTKTKKIYRFEIFYL